MTLHPLFSGFKGDSPYVVGAALGFAIHVETVLGALPSTLDPLQRVRMREGGDLVGFQFAGGWGAPGAHCLMFAKPLTRLAATWWRSGVEDDVPWVASALRPCPFCAGPPVVSVGEYSHGAVALLADYGDEGQAVEAMVHCHECGAQGPAIEETLFDQHDYQRVQQKAREQWQARDARHIELYLSSPQWSFSPT